MTLEDNVQSPVRLQGWPLLRLGFRPFYLGSALLASVLVPLWIAVFLGLIDLELRGSSLLWHGHEMLFGFAGGVIVGFLLTAVKAWTGLPTPHGFGLGVIVLFWFAARLAALAAPYPIYMALDMLWLPAVAMILLRVLIKAGNRKNMALISLLLAMALANLTFHLSLLEVIAIAPLSALHAQLGLIVMVVSVMAGRVVPAFTQNAIPGLTIRPARGLELAVLLTTAAALVLWILVAPGWLGLLVCMTAAVLHAVRLYRWQPWVTRKRPMLWILHASYAWLPVGFALLGLAELGWVDPSLATGVTPGRACDHANDESANHPHAN